MCNTMVILKIYLHILSSKVFISGLYVFLLFLIHLKNQIGDLSYLLTTRITPFLLTPFKYQVLRNGFQQRSFKSTGHMLRNTTNLLF